MEINIVNVALKDANLLIFPLPPNGAVIARLKSFLRKSDF